MKRVSDCKELSSPSAIHTSHFSFDEASALDKATVDTPPLHLAFFCSTYLQPEMLHIYRQIRALALCEPLVITQKAIHLDRFPWTPLEIISRSPFREIQRFVAKKLDVPWQISKTEARRIRQLLAKYDIDLLHVFFGNVAIHLLPLLRKLDIPYVVSFHGADVAREMEKPNFLITLQEVFTRAAVIACRSDSLARSLISLGAPEDKICITRTIIPDRGGFIRTSPANSSWKLLQACRLVAKKGILTTLRAVALLKPKYPNLQLHLAGEGPEQSAIEALAKQLGLQETVFFHGFVDQELLQRLYHESHLFIHPSEDPGDGNVEGIPNALLEAMMSGLPIIATYHGGIAEAVRDGQDGYLCPERDPVAVASALEKLFTTPDLLEAFSQSARAHVQGQFSEAIVGRQLLGMYQEIRRIQH